MKRKITCHKLFRNAQSERDAIDTAILALKNIIGQAICRTMNGRYWLRDAPKDYTVEELMEIAVKCKAEIEIIIPDA